MLEFSLDNFYSQGRVCGTLPKPHTQHSLGSMFLRYTLAWLILFLQCGEGHSEKEIKTEESDCTPRFVALQTQIRASNCLTSQDYLEKIVHPSFQGPRFLAEDSCNNGFDMGGSRCHRVALCSLSEYQWVESVLLRQIRWLMGRWLPTYQQTQSRSLMDLFGLARLEGFKRMASSETAITGTQSIQQVQQVGSRWTVHKEAKPEIQGSRKRQRRQSQRQSKTGRTGPATSKSCGASDLDPLAQDEEFCTTCLASSYVEKHRLSWAMRNLFRTRMRWWKPSKTRIQSLHPGPTM